MYFFGGGSYHMKRVVDVCHTAASGGEMLCLMCLVDRTLKALRLSVSK